MLFPSLAPSMRVLPVLPGGRYHRSVKMNLSEPISRRDRLVVLACSVASTVALIICERSVGPAVPLGGFFFLPLFLAAAAISRWPIFFFAVAVAVSREYFGPTDWQQQGAERLALSLLAYTGGALFASELFRNRRMAAEFEGRAQQESRLRLEAEQEARAIVDSSPAAVLTVDSSGHIALANEAARKLLGFASGSPEGDLVEKYFPLLKTLLNSKRAVNLMRTMVEARGRRLSGEEFYLQAWVSSYGSGSGQRLAAILLDVTEQLRDREESGLRQLLSNSRIIAGAVSHELRNLAAAAAVLHHNLRGCPAVQGNPDFEALGTVIDSVLKLSSTELSDSSEEVLEGISVSALLQELRAMIAPRYEDADVGLEWEIAEPLPAVRANYSGLLQVFLNIAQNSLSVLEGRADARVRIAAYALPQSVIVRFADNGPGVSSAERLFQPFQPGASSTGLGLFVSRAIVRTFGGELHHTQRQGECCFIIEMPPMAPSEQTLD